MKIGIYDPYLDSLSGGEKYMLSMAECLSHRHEVDVFWDDRTVADKASMKLNLDLKKVNIRTNYFTSKSKFSERILKSKEYDLLIILSDGSIPLTLAHRTFLHFQHPVEWVDLSIKTRLKLFKINKIICNSFFTKKFIDKKFGVNSVVLYPPCISKSAISNDLNENLQLKKNVILTVGRFSPADNGTDVKKIGIMIETFKKMVDEGLKNWEFVCAVSYLKENENFFKKSIKNTGNYPIRIVENCSFDMLADLYKKAKIYWHGAGYGEDLDRNPERAEHFGITTVEAIANGAVPIVFNGGGQTEIVEDRINGFLWDDLEELKTKTKKIMIDDKLRIDMNRIGRRKIEDYTFENFCSRLEQITK